MNSVEMKAGVLMSRIHIISVEVELGHNHHFDCLVQSAKHSQTLLVPVPVEAADTLLADVSLVEQLHFPHHPRLLPLTVRYAALRRVVVLVKI